MARRQGSPHTRPHRARAQDGDPAHPRSREPHRARPPRARQASQRLTAHRRVLQLPTGARGDLDRHSFLSAIQRFKTDRESCSDVSLKTSHSCRKTLENHSRGPNCHQVQKIAPDQSRPILADETPWQGPQSWLLWRPKELERGLGRQVEPPGVSTMNNSVALEVPPALRPRALIIGPARTCRKAGSVPKRNPTWKDS
jgi:hypothetical protein